MGAARRVLASVAALILLPLGVLVARSFDGSGGLGYYRALTSADAGGGTFAVPPLEAVGNSLRYALAATAIAVVVGGLAAAALTPRSRPGAAGRTGPSGAGRLLRGFDALLMLPLGVSAVTVGFGFLIALDEPPLDLRQEWILVPLAQALVGVPFVVRTMLPVLRAVDERLREAAAVLGRHRCGSGARWTCRWSGAPCWSRPDSRSPCRWASSARPCSSPAPTSRPFRWPSPGCWGGPGSSTTARRWPCPRS